MIRTHCDRCDVLCDKGYPKWVEDKSSPLDALGGVGSASNPIWHVEIDAGGDIRNHYQKVFCRACWIAILEMHVAVLKAEKQHA